MVARKAFSSLRLWAAAFFLTWVFYAIAAQLVWMILPQFRLPTSPVSRLEPFRIANQYGLFAVMTRGRYEIEFQGSNDGKTWTPYPFRYKPQDPRAAPGIFAPYQPRFDWNLWFASLDNWQQNRFVVYAEERLIDGLALGAIALCRESVSEALRRRKCGRWSGSTGSAIAPKRIRDCGGAAN